ncbi:hypothetical protein RCM52_14740 [Escherichia marmotae]|uniref:hypothetical protein n=1 Tax=Escherichia marmotae TaxID=1499973 RepID=UPI001F18E217|nr:hypothetical protein [Escherichia marmotae]MCE5377081.1 hypothetical protein [Escherichia marmotae]MEC9834525.1 hypothetical protein [Escherichia marmotae]MED8861830.1 hypothetical protein [Escherichia marmotae]MED9032596.1 hypothetical protein [Escherichia marmotae]MED9045761.1 hypothetical protein [Escherichia marmotae]
MDMKILLPISSCLLFLPESNAAHQSISPSFLHYTLVCEREQINPGINLSEYYSENEFDLCQYYAFRCPDIENQVRGPSVSVLLRVSAKSPFEDRLNISTSYAVYPDYNIDKLIYWSDDGNREKSTLNDSVNVTQ